MFTDRTGDMQMPFSGQDKITNIKQYFCLKRIILYPFETELKRW